MPRITELFAFIVADGGPDNEGVPAYQMNGAYYPLVGADMKRIDSLRGMAQQWADENGKPMKLARFTVREELETIVPRARQ